MDTNRPFSYVFEDPNWLSKVLIGGLLALTGILYPSLIGYMIDTARTVRDGVARPLPTCGDDFGGRWVRGFSLSVIGFIYFAVISLPFLCIGAGLGSALGAGGSASDATAGLFGGALVALYCAWLPALLVAGLAYPALVAHYVNRGTFGSGFDLGAIWRIMNRDWGQYLMVWVLFIVAGFISGAGAVVCIGLIFTQPYATLIMAHLVGQLARAEPAGAALRTEF